MYPGLQAKIRPQQAAFVMATSGEAVTYAELEARSNRLAHFLRASGLRRLDHYAIFMENNARYVECCSAGERTGLYYTCVNSHLTADEAAYIVDNSQSKILITSVSKREVALAAMAQCPRIERVLVVDGPGNGAKVVNLDAAVVPRHRPTLLIRHDRAAKRHFAAAAGGPAGTGIADLRVCQ